MQLVKEQVNGQTWRHVNEQIHMLVRTQAYRQVGEQLYIQVHSRVSKHVWNQVKQNAAS